MDNNDKRTFMVKKVCFGFKTIDKLVNQLLPDAKLRKNIRQQIVRGNLACNLAQIMKALPNVHRQKIASHVAVHTF